MSETIIREGKTRGQFTITYHEVWDLYHPLMGDTSTLFYLYLCRYRNFQNGKAWKGRTSILKKFRISSKTLPRLDKILQAVGLIDIETVKSSKGKDRIIYILNDPLTREEFRELEDTFKERLMSLIIEDKAIRKMLGKESENLF